MLSGDLNICVLDAADLYKQITANVEATAQACTYGNESVISKELPKISGIDSIVAQAVNSDTIILLNKADLLTTGAELVISQCKATLAQQASVDNIHAVSCETQYGMPDFFAWLKEYLASR